MLNTLFVTVLGLAALVGLLNSLQKADMLDDVVDALLHRSRRRQASTETDRLDSLLVAETIVLPARLRPVPVSEEPLESRITDIASIVSELSTQMKSVDNTVASAMDQLSSELRGIFGANNEVFKSVSSASAKIDELKRAATGKPQGGLPMSTRGSTGPYDERFVAARLKDRIEGKLQSPDPLHPPVPTTNVASILLASSRIVELEDHTRERVGKFTESTWPDHHLILTGDPGQGKSFALRSIAYEVANSVLTGDAGNDHVYVALVRAAGLEEFVPPDWLNARHAWPKNILKRIVEAQIGVELSPEAVGPRAKYLLLIDDVDSLELPRQLALGSFLAELSNHQYCRIIATSRGAEWVQDPPNPIRRTVVAELMPYGRDAARGALLATISQAHPDHQSIVGVIDQLLADERAEWTPNSVELMVDLLTSPADRDATSAASAFQHFLSRRLKSQLSEWVAIGGVPVPPVASVENPEADVPSDSAT